MLAVVLHSCPPIFTGWATDRSRLETSSSTGRLSVSFTIATNSSPPSRATTLSTPRDFFRRRRGLHEQTISGFVAERVIDDLEAIEIDEKQGKLASAPSFALDSLPQKGAKSCPVGQIRQKIVGGEIGDLLVGKPLLVGLLEICRGRRTRSRRGDRGAPRSPA